MPNVIRTFKSNWDGLFLSMVGAGLSLRASGLSLLVQWLELVLPLASFSAAHFQGSRREDFNSLRLAFCVCFRKADSTVVTGLRCFGRKGYQ